MSGIVEWSGVRKIADIDEIKSTRKRESRERERLERERERETGTRVRESS